MANRIGRERESGQETGKIADVDNLLDQFKSMGLFIAEERRGEWSKILEWVDFVFNHSEGTIGISIDKGGKLTEGTLLVSGGKPKLQISRGIKIRDGGVMESFTSELPVYTVACDNEKGELIFVGGALITPAYATFHRVGKVKIESD